MYVVALRAVLPSETYVCGLGPRTAGWSPQKLLVPDPQTLRAQELLGGAGAACKLQRQRREARREMPRGAARTRGADIIEGGIQHVKRDGGDPMAEAQWRRPCGDK